MSSKGTPRYTFRVPPTLMQEIRLAIDRRNVYTRDEPWTLTGFVIAALAEKLAKMERSRGGRRIDPEMTDFPVTAHTNP
jgi:hypothetical protein